MIWLMKIMLINSTQKIRAGIQSLSNILPENGHNVYIVTPDESRGSLDEKDDVEYFYYEANYIPGIRYTLPRFSFLNVLNKNICNMDIIHIYSYFYPACLISSFIADRTDTACVITIDSLPGIGWTYGNKFIDSIGKIYTHTFGRYTFKLADRIVLLGDYLKEDLYNFTEHDKIKVIPNGIDVSWYNSINLIDDKDNIQILYMGRLDPVKGLPLLFEALSILNNSGNGNYTLSLVGDGTMRDEYKNMCEKIGIDSTVDFLGYTDNPKKYYSDHDIVVLPSISEGQSTVLMEAQACGIPVVSTDTGGSREIVEVGKVISKRDPQMLANAILKVVEEYSPDQHKQARENIVKNYSYDSMYSEYIELYNSII